MGACLDKIFKRGDTANYDKTHRNGAPPPSDMGFFDASQQQERFSSNPPPAGGITIEERKSLRRCREDIIRTIDIIKVLEIMFHKEVISVDDEDKVLEDPRRRQRITIFLDILEQKPAETYGAFLEALEEHYPHLFLRLTDWEEDDEGYKGGGYGIDMLNTDTDEWGKVRYYKAYMIKEMDCDRILAIMEPKEILGEMELKQIRAVKNRERRCETFLDILETKESTAHEVFLEAVSEVHPNIYLMLTDRNDDDDINLDDL